jgi:Sulfotransferase family
METLRIDSRGLPICRNPIFVMGSPRSGTTVLARALNRHPDFWASDETLFMPALFGGGRVESEIERWTSRPRGSWLRRQNVSREEFLSYLGMGLNALFTNRSEGKRWIDHTPHHVLMAEVLAAMFPGAFFLHLLRDGRRVVHSMIHFSDKLAEDQREEMKAGGFFPAWVTNFKVACQTWQERTAAGLAFCEKHPERALNVRLEELARNPGQAFEDVLSFLQATPSDAPGKYFHRHRFNSSFSTSVIVGDMAAEEPPDPWESWTAEQKALFNQIAGGTMSRLESNASLQATA